MMNKGLETTSWNWTGSSGEYETGAMSGDGDFRSPIWESSSRFDTFSPGKSVIEMQDDYDYGGGILSRVEEDLDWEDFWEGEGYMEPNMSLSKILDKVDEGDSILDVGSGDGSHAKIMANRGLDVVGIDISQGAAIDTDKFVSVSGDIRHYDFGKKFDAFQALSVLEHIDGVDIALDNIYKHLKPSAYGVVHIGADERGAGNVISAIEGSEFRIIEKSKLKIDDRMVLELVLEKSEQSKMASVSIISDCSSSICPVTGSKISQNSKYVYTYNGSKYYTSSFSNFIKISKNPDRYLGGKISFLCDVSYEYRDKIDGLQTYSSLKKNAGMLFTYKEASDVIYHMGRVQFPIDIIFIGSDSRIKKIYKDIPPGSLATFGCARTSSVLEINGGMCDRLGIFIGNKVDISSGDKNVPSIANIVSSHFKSSAIVKESSDIESRVYSFNNQIILEKNLSDKKNGISDFIKISSFSPKNIAVYDLRPLFLEGFGIKLFYKDSAYNISSADLFFSKGTKELFSLLKSGPSGSYKGALGSSFFSRNSSSVIKDMARDVLKGNNIAVILPSANGSFLAKEFIVRCVQDFSGAWASMPDFDTLYYTMNDSGEYIKESVRRKYSGFNINMRNTCVIKKESGTSVSDVTKKRAKEALEYFSKSSSYLNDIYSGLQKNVEQYNNISDNQNSISSSKGQYNESCKKLRDMLEEALKSTLSGIKVMSSIKDISTTMDIVDSMATICKMSADSVQEVFRLIDKIETLEFISLLQEKTSESINILDDYKESLKRMNNYINQDIMGILIISE